MGEYGPSGSGEPSTFLEDHHIPPMAFGFLALVGVFLLYQVGGGILTYLAIGELTVSPQNVQMVRLVTLLSQLLFILAPSIILARLVTHDLRSIFPFRIPSFRELAVQVMSLLALQRVLETAVYLQGQIPLPDVVESIVGPIKEMLQVVMQMIVSTETLPEFIFVVVVVAIVPAFAEELYFRGLVQSLFARAWTPFWGAIASGVLFGLFHLNPFDAVGLVGLGIFFGYIRYRSASMVPPILLHFLNNFLAVGSVRMGMKSDEMLVESVGRTADLETMLLQGLVFGVLLAWMLWLYHRITRPVVAETT